jgi:hypothetical protein
MKDWDKAEAQYRKKGYSEAEIKKYKKAWEQKHGKLPSAKMLGKGLASEAAEKVTSRKKKLEELAAELEGKEF